MNKQQVNKLISTLNNAKIREHAMIVLSQKERGNIAIMAEGYAHINLFILVIGKEYYWYDNAKKCDYDLSVLHKVFGKEIDQKNSLQYQYRQRAIQLS